MGRDGTALSAALVVCVVCARVVCVCYIYVCVCVCVCVQLHHLVILLLSLTLAKREGHRSYVWFCYGMYVLMVASSAWRSRGGSQVSVVAGFWFFWFLFDFLLLFWFICFCSLALFFFAFFGLPKERQSAFGKNKF